MGNDMVWCICGYFYKILYIVFGMLFLSDEDLMDDKIGYMNVYSLIENYMF